MDVFISYSSKDEAIVRETCEAFKKCNIHYWVSFENHDYGNQYASTIISKIEEAKIAVVFVSRSSNLSTHVINEISVAVSRGKRVIPIIIDEFNLTPAFEYYLSSNHFIKYVDNEKFNEQLVRCIYDVLGREFHESMRSDDTQDTAAQQELVQRAQLGDIQAMFRLGENYYAGSNRFTKDLKKAYEWFLKAAEKGHAGAMCNVAWCYENEDGVDQDWDQAYKWYVKSAELNCSMAQYSLGWMYENGIYVAKNKTKATELYIKAAENGHGMAQYKLGMAYMEGITVDCNYIMANHWLMLACDQGVVFAQYQLAENFYFGKGCERDIIKAKNMWLLASARGYERADCALEQYYDIYYNDDKKDFYV